MHHRSRYMLFLMLLAILLATVPSALAQETFGLSADDYALFSSPNMDADSVSFDVGLDFSVTGTSDGAMTAALTGTGTIGKDSAGMPLADVSVTGSINSNGEDTPVDLQLRIVDGVLYYNLGNDTGWFGQAMEDMASSLPVNPSDLASGDMSENPEAMAAIGEMMGALADMDVAQYVSVARLGDMNNQAHFQVSLDLSGFLQSDAFSQILDTASSMSGDDSMAGMGAMIGMMFQNMSLTYDQFVDLSDNYIRQGILDLAMSINPAMMGAGSGDSAPQPVDVAFHLDVSNLQYDVPVSVTAPDGAMMIPGAGAMSQ